MPIRRTCGQVLRNSKEQASVLNPLHLKHPILANTRPQHPHCLRGHLKETLQDTTDRRLIYLNDLYFWNFEETEF